MNVFNLSAEKANYVPTWVSSKAASGGGWTNSIGATALEIAERALGRKLFAAVPIEIRFGEQDAWADGDTAMAKRLRQSATNIHGSTLLRLKSEADEGSILHKLVSGKLEEFRAEFGEPIPNYTPAFIPPLRSPLIKRTFEPNYQPPPPYPTKAAEQDAEYLDDSAPQGLTQQAKMMMMSSWLKQFEINNELFALVD